MKGKSATHKFTYHELHALTMVRLSQVSKKLIIYMLKKYFVVFAKETAREMQQVGHWRWQQGQWW